MEKQLLIEKRLEELYLLFAYARHDLTRQNLPSFRVFYTTKSEGGTVAEMNTRSQVIEATKETLQSDEEKFNWLFKSFLVSQFVGCSHVYMLTDVIETLLDTDSKVCLTVKARSRFLPGATKVYGNRCNAFYIGDIVSLETLAKYSNLDSAKESSIAKLMSLFREAHRWAYVQTFDVLRAFKQAYAMNPAKNLEDGHLVMLQRTQLFAQHFSQMRKTTVEELKEMGLADSFKAKVDALYKQQFNISKDSVLKKAKRNVDKIILQQFLTRYLLEIDFTALSVLFCTNYKEYVSCLLRWFVFDGWIAMFLRKVAMTPDSYRKAKWKWLKVLLSITAFTGDLLLTQYFHETLGPLYESQTKVIYFNGIGKTATWPSLPKHGIYFVSPVFAAIMSCQVEVAKFLLSQTLSSESDYEQLRLATNTYLNKQKLISTEQKRTVLDVLSQLQE